MSSFEKLYFSFFIDWSPDDNAFVAEAPELPGCLAHGNTHEKALANIHTAMDIWIKTAKEFNDPIPEPGASSCFRLTGIKTQNHLELSYAGCSNPGWNTR